MQKNKNSRTKKEKSKQDEYFNNVLRKFAERKNDVKDFIDNGYTGYTSSV